MIPAPELPQPRRAFAPRPTTQIAIGCVFIPLMVLMVILGAFLYLRSRASARLMVPADQLLLVYALPEDTAPLLARFGAGRQLDISGRSEDWRWLEVRLWDGRRGWARRPLEILVWQIEATPTAPVPLTVLPPVRRPVVAAMIAIPATSFTMGSPPGLGEADEQPAHVVHLSAFEIDRTEVTVAQYWQCVKARTCNAPSSDAVSTEAHYLNDPAFDHHPVVNVSWHQARTYCRWRGKRLPSEAEWELAAGWDVERRAKWPWPWGNAAGPVRANLGVTALKGPAQVGSFPADRSAAGVLDMGGNVSEWVFDWYKVDYYRRAEATNPMGPSPRRGAGSGRVVRGGSFMDAPAQARTANRRHYAEAYGYPTVGFRCVREGTSR